MAVGIEGVGYGGVTEHLRDELGMYVAGEEQGGARVLELVEAGIGWKTGAREEPGEEADSEVGVLLTVPLASLVNTKASGTVEGERSLHLLLKPVIFTVPKNLYADNIYGIERSAH